MSVPLRVAEAAGPGRRATAVLGRPGGVALAHLAGVGGGRDEDSGPAASRRPDIDHHAQACSVAWRKPQTSSLLAVSGYLRVPRLSSFSRKFSHCPKLPVASPVTISNLQCSCVSLAGFFHSLTAS